jgi:hypothetical protein
MPVLPRRAALALVVGLLVAGLALGVYACLRPRSAFDDLKPRLSIDPGATKGAEPGLPGQPP